MKTTDEIRALLASLPYTAPEERVFESIVAELPALLDALDDFEFRALEAEGVLNTAIDERDEARKDRDILAEQWARRTVGEVLP